MDTPAQPSPEEQVAAMDAEFESQRTTQKQAETIVKNQLHAFRQMARSLDEHYQTVGIAMTLLTVMPRLEAILDSQRQIIELLTPKAPTEKPLVLPSTGVIR